MLHPLTGIHHITAISSDPVKTVDFYTRILGLRLVKKSVNQDDVATYHLFFGDQTGEPGMDFTFFTFQPTFPGRRGGGQVTKTSFTVPRTSLTFWHERFASFSIKQESIDTEFGHERLIFFDFDDQRLELVGVDDKASSPEHIWTTQDIQEAQAIRSFHSAELTVARLELIEPILVYAFGYQLVDKHNNKFVYQAQKSDRAAMLEVVVDPATPAGQTGAGTVHHIAFRVRDEAHQQEVRRALQVLGLQPTPVIDRFYFKSVYFRTPAGILFEIATDGPGFTADENEPELGLKLALPPFLEPQRSAIEAGLPSLKVAT